MTYVVADIATSKHMRRSPGEPGQAAKGPQSERKRTSTTETGQSEAFVQVGASVQVETPAKATSQAYPDAQTKEDTTDTTNEEAPSS